jgi:hypothetical protein
MGAFVPAFDAPLGRGRSGLRVWNGPGALGVPVPNDKIQAQIIAP